MKNKNNMENQGFKQTFHQFIEATECWMQKKNQDPTFKLLLREDAYPYTMGGDEFWSIIIELNISSGYIFRMEGVSEDDLYKKLMGYMGYILSESIIEHGVKDAGLRVWD